MTEQGMPLRTFKEFASQVTGPVQVFCSQRIGVHYDITSSSLFAPGSYTPKQLSQNSCKLPPTSNSNDAKAPSNSRDFCDPLIFINDRDSCRRSSVELKL